MMIRRVMRGRRFGDAIQPRVHPLSTDTLSIDQTKQISSEFMCEGSIQVQDERTTLCQIWCHRMTRITEQCDVTPTPRFQDR